jgi:hypothetical protein
MEKFSRRGEEKTNNNIRIGEWARATLAKPKAWPRGVRAFFIRADSRYS